MRSSLAIPILLLPLSAFAVPLPFDAVKSYQRRGPVEPVVGGAAAKPLDASTGFASDLASKHDPLQTTLFPGSRGGPHEGLPKPPSAATIDPMVAHGIKRPWSQKMRTDWHKTRDWLKWYLGELADFWKVDPLHDQRPWLRKERTKSGKAFPPIADKAFPPKEILPADKKFLKFKAVRPSSKVVPLDNAPSI